MKYKGTDEGSDVPQLVSNFHESHRRDLIHVFDLEIARNMSNKL